MIEYDHYKRTSDIRFCIIKDIYINLYDIIVVFRLYELVCGVLVVI